jgi:hypothetical protein
VTAPEEGAPELTPLEGLIGEYREWLVVERGLAAATVLRYETLAQRFLRERVAPDDELGVAGLTGAEVSAFLVRECACLSLGSANSGVAELRSLLRFLHVGGCPAYAELRIGGGTPQTPRRLVGTPLEHIAGEGWSSTQCERAALFLRRALLPANEPITSSAAVNS